VPRGRSKKNGKNKKQRNRNATRKAAPRTGSQSGQKHAEADALTVLTALASSLPGAQQAMAQARSWWPGSHAEVIAGAPGLLSCGSPDELEDAVCDLLGGHWRRWFDEHDLGLALAEWLESLIEAATAHAGDPAVRRLLHGIAAVATPGLADSAVQVLRRAAPPADEPGWLPDTYQTVASPDILLLRDGYGLRFGLLIEITGPNRPTRTYLMDVDLCHNFDEVLACGYYPDVQTAATAWRALAGPSAEGSAPQPASPELLPVVLPGGGVLDQFFGRPLTASQFTECYRADRIVHAAAEAQEAAGRPIVWPRESSQEHTARAAGIATEFRTWAETTGVDLPPGELVEWMLDDWIRALPGDLPLSCSPHRIAAFTAYLVDDWVDDHREAALALLEPWARYCIERTDLAAPLAEHALTWARRAAQEPEQVGGDLGNDLNRPICETTVQSPPFRA
jgi:hypothetical protein